MAAKTQAELAGEGAVVYVPVPGSRYEMTVADGAGIAGRGPGPEGDRVIVYYEGNTVGSINMVTYADRVHHAAGRLATKAPTSAMMLAETRLLRRVGQWDGVEGVVRLDGPDEEAALAAYLGTATLDPAELVATSAHYQMRRDVRRALASGNPATIHFARDYARRHHIDL